MWLRESVMSVDAVVVLAHLMEANGVLNEESAKRASKAAELFEWLGADALVTCGWAYRGDSDIAVADAFSRHIVESYEIPPSRIVIERNSRDTVGDAYFTKLNLAIPRGWKTLVVVTSGYHVARARKIFEFIYGDGFSIDAAGTDFECDSLQLANEIKSLEAFHKTFAGVASGDTAQILSRMRELHPFYNGDVYAKI